MVAANEKTRRLSGFFISLLLPGGAAGERLQLIERGATPVPRRGVCWDRPDVTGEGQREEEGEARGRLR